VHPSDDFVRVVGLVEADLAGERQTYLVLPHAYSQLVDEAARYRIFACITRDGSVFLWPIKATENAWHVTALVAARHGRHSWLRLKSNRDAGCYEMIEPVNPTAIPEPEWPSRTMAELLELGFTGRVIDSVDHEVVRHLRGIE
jgi:hypothetical protein